MSRRTEHSNLSYALLGTFVSRNNDVDGYWAIGRLRAESERLASPILLLDILKGTSQPDARDSRIVASFYREWIRTRIEKFTNPAAVAAVLVRLDFTPDAPLKVSRETSTYGKPYMCEVSVVSTTGGTRTSSHIGRCAPHDPHREHRSTRAPVRWYDRLFT